MKKQIYKPFLTALMAALMSLPGITAFPVQAQTENETVETVSGGDVGETGVHTLVETDTYTDSNGNSYKWYGYNDQTAEIYEIVPFADQVTMDIPSAIGGYKVTSITASLKNQTLESAGSPGDRGEGT